MIVYIMRIFRCLMLFISIFFFECASVLTHLAKNHLIYTVNLSIRMTEKLT